MANSPSGHLLTVELLLVDADPPNDESPSSLDRVREDEVEGWKDTKYL